MSVRVCRHATHVCRTMLMNVLSPPGLKPRVHTHVPLHHLHPTVVLWPTHWIRGEHLSVTVPLTTSSTRGHFLLGCITASKGHEMSLCFCFYAVVPSPFFSPPGKKVGELKLCTKDAGRKTLQKHLKCFPPPLFWEMSSHPRNTFKRSTK